MAIHYGFVSASCHKGKALPRNIPMLSWGEKWGLVRRWVEHGHSQEVAWRRKSLSQPPKKINVRYLSLFLVDNWLVVLTILKNISQMGWLFPYIMEKKFQTTNQLRLIPMTSPFSNGFPMVFLWFMVIYDTPNQNRKRMVGLRAVDLIRPRCKPKASWKKEGIQDTQKNLGEWIDWLVVDLYTPLKNMS